MKGQEVKCKVSLDNLTIVGTPKYKASQIRSLLISKGFINQFWQTPYKKYNDNYTLIGGGMLQVTHDTGFVDSDKFTIHQIRLEFNPNKIGLYKQLTGEYLDLLRLICDPKITRKDIAIDLFDLDINDYTVIDFSTRKRIEYKTGNMRLETLYFGSKTSDERIRIYDKAVEQGLGEFEGYKIKWWRVEAQLRKEKAEKMKFNPFGKVRIVSKQEFLHYDVRTRAMLMYLQANPDSMKELSVNARTKYKKLLGEQIEEWYIDLEGIASDNLGEIQSQIMSWLNFAPVEVKEGFTVRALVSCLKLDEDKMTESEKEDMTKKIEEWVEVNASEYVSCGTKQDFEDWVKSVLGEDIEE